MADENTTDQSGEGHDGGADAAAAIQNLGSELSSTFSKLGGGERLAVLGAAIVLAGWLLFDLLLDKYSVGQVGFVLSVVAVGAAFFHYRRTAGSDPVPYTSLLFAAAGLLGLIGATDMIEEIRNSIFDANGTTVVGALVFYVGSIMSGVGAVRLRSGSK